jgi:hypothetical protein
LLENIFLYQVSLLLHYLRTDPRWAVKAQVLQGLHLLAGQGAHLWPPGAVEAIVDVALNTPYQKVLSWSLDVLQVLAKSTATCHSQLHPGKGIDECGIHYTELYSLYLILGFSVCLSYHNCLFHIKLSFFPPD